ncbi:hypothetical protein SD70_12090 [Gordoniibacillus kamchatkensis]|uniref:Uncharacterized protein n=1 Tax=Gordoniibacillus kamchatkensis TaxID=1590651 RepID=A0ABR5AHX4_9BACL|nr:DUF6470 family protein [Paenibacillus sp. VKM B-2647]KIL40650.1 hypothetical protein SD70_12090 [Paenibacillus sp. VKM B-2647]
MNDLRLSIHQTFAQIGIQTYRASQEMQLPKGDLQIQQPKAQIDIHSPPGQLQIDSSEAWSALGVGPNLAWNSMIYSQCQSVALQAIAKTVEDGNRMAQITNHGDAFADIASDVFERQNPIEYTGNPAYDNVKITYTPQKPEIHIEAQHPIIQYTPQKPDIQYNPGSVDIYLKQKQAIDISVTKYDIYK